MKCQSIVGVASSRQAAWAFAAAAITLIAAPSIAAERTPQVAVSLEDLNLSSEQDAGRLYSRLKAASRNVCRDFEGRDLARLGARKACYANALANAVNEVNHSAVTALHVADQRIRLAQRDAPGQPLTAKAVDR